MLQRLPVTGGGRYAVVGQHAGSGFDPQATPRQLFHSCRVGVRPPEEDDPRQHFGQK